jgi:hypothetical protein
MYDINDKELDNFSDPLIGPSMSAEFFDSLGLIICGQNLLGKTQFKIFSSKNKLWTTANIGGINNFSFISLKLFEGNSDQTK